jgi:hypothetical protein
MWWAGDAPAGPPAWQTWLPALIGVVIAAVVGAVGTVAVKRMNRRLDEATAVKTEAETGKARAETVSIEVATARALLSEVREMMVEQRAGYETQVQSLRTQHQADMRQLADRLGGIEKAVAIHREWDLAATAILQQVSPEFQPPPPFAL